MHHGAVGGVPVLICLLKKSNRPSSPLASAFSSACKDVDAGLCATESAHPLILAEGDGDREQHDEERRDEPHEDLHPPRQAALECRHAVGALFRRNATLTPREWVRLAPDEEGLRQARWATPAWAPQPGRVTQACLPGRRSGSVVMCRAVLHATWQEERAVGPVPTAGEEWEWEWREGTSAQWIN